jgi:hypothetical protein
MNCGKLEVKDFEDGKSESAHDNFRLSHHKEANVLETKRKVDLRVRKRLPLKVKNQSIRIKKGGHSIVKGSVINNLMHYYIKRRGFENSGAIS